MVGIRSVPELSDGCFFSVERQPFFGHLGRTRIRMEVVLPGAPILGSPVGLVDLRTDHGAISSGGSSPFTGVCLVPWLWAGPGADQFRLHHGSQPRFPAQPVPVSGSLPQAI